MAACLLFPLHCSLLCICERVILNPSPLSVTRSTCASVHHRLPFWTQLREAEPHDPETQPPAQPCSPIKPRRHPARPNGSSPGSDGYSDSTCPARPDTSSDQPSSDWPSCTSSLPACTSWDPAEPGHPALWPPDTALPPRRQVRHLEQRCFCLDSAGAFCMIP